MQATRLSIGGQSSNNETLKTLGRSHTHQDTLRAIDLLRASGTRYSDLQSVNIDYLIGSPSETHKQSLDSLKSLLDINSGHLSAYLLEIVEGTPFSRRYRDGVQPLPHPKDLKILFKDCLQLIGDTTSLNRYQISNFSKEGMECSHNMMYWRSRNDFLGVGLGASGMYNGKRIKNSTSMKKYKNRIDELVLDE